MSTWILDDYRNDTLCLVESIEEGPLAEIVCYGDVSRDEVATALNDATKAALMSPYEPFPDGLPEPLYTDIESEIHQHMGHDGQSDEANDWVSDLMAGIAPFIVRELVTVVARAVTAEATLAAKDAEQDAIVLDADLQRESYMAADAARRRAEATLAAARRAYNPDNPDWDALEAALGYTSMPNGPTVSVRDLLDDPDQPNPGGPTEDNR